MLSFTLYLFLPSFLLLPSAKEHDLASKQNLLSKHLALSIAFSPPFTVKYLGIIVYSMGSLHSCPSHSFFNSFSFDPLTTHSMEIFHVSGHQWPWCCQNQRTLLRPVLLNPSAYSAWLMFLKQFLVWFHQSFPCNPNFILLPSSNHLLSLFRIWIQGQAWDPLLLFLYTIHLSVQIFSPGFKY